MDPACIHNGARVNPHSEGEFVMCHLPNKAVS